MIAILSLVYIIY